MVAAPFNADAPRSIAATIFLAISGWMVFMSMPIMVGIFADVRGYSNAQVGYLASAELAGVLVSSVIASLVLKSMNRRVLAASGLLLSLVINIVSLQVEPYGPFLALRTLAGFGSGMCYAIAVANLASTQNSARNYSCMIFALVACNAAILYFLPQLADLLGLAGVLYSFAAVNAATLLAIPLIAPSLIASKTETTAPAPMPQSSINAAWLCLLAIALFYTCIGSYWAYIERWGVEAGFSSDFIGTTLAVSTVLSLIGCYFAYRVSRIMGQFRPMILTLGFLGITIAITAAMPTKTIYFLGLVIYQLLWNSVDIYQLGTLANIDKSGRFTALISGAQGVGQMIGPAGAASILVLGYGLSGAMYFAAGTAGLATLVYLITRLYLNRSGYVEPLAT